MENLPDESVVPVVFTVPPVIFTLAPGSAPALRLLPLTMFV